MMAVDLFDNYVEAVILDEEGNEKVITKKVTDRNPLYMKFNDNVVAFRFFSSAFAERRVDYSNWFFNGEELSISRFVLRYGDNLAFRRYMADINKFGAYKVCVIPNGSVYVMNKEDVTMNQVKAHLSNDELESYEQCAEAIGAGPSIIDNTPVTLIKKLF